MKEFSNLINKLKCLALPFVVILMSSCNSSPNIELVKTNLNEDKIYELDYSDSYKNGFIVPSKQINNIDSFEVSFKINNDKEDQLFYKIYYQNESYKFPESTDGIQNILANENFYGSWENTERAFETIKTEDSLKITSFFRITGNPRNESQFYGVNSHKDLIAEEKVNSMMKHIESNEAWLSSIVEKAEKKGISTEMQLKLDAIWNMSNDSKKDPVNNKWQRNLRVGKYSLLIVVTNKEGLNSIPNYIQNVSLQNKNNEFVNPYYYFLYGNGKANSNMNTLLIQDFITVKATPPLTKGIYVDYNSSPFEDKSYLNKYVNNSKELFSSATFTYHYSHQANTKAFMNIPVKTNFNKEGYSQKEYNENLKLTDNYRVKTYFTNSLSPGRTFGINEDRKALWFKNPGNTTNEFKKENVGVKTRHGFTYGKYTFKIKMASLLTSDNVWTGVTNAIWLICENGKWNTRRICNKGGFMPYYGAGKGEKRIPQTTYSEIDFEILKAAEVWPRASYGDELERVEPKSNNDKVMIACTNWDMACLQPDNFSAGLKQIAYKNNTFNIHRWDNYYNALTSKFPEKNDVLFGGEYYYFQIEWRPNEIIWRVGPEKENLHVVGYMNDKVTTIPNNQMLAVITQEFHFSEWWPMSPYKQENIPFSREDLNGMLYSLEIE